MKEGKKRKKKYQPPQIDFFPASLAFKGGAQCKAGGSPGIAGKCKDGSYADTCQTGITVY
jgi:hypothetical protein